MSTKPPSSIKSDATSASEQLTLLGYKKGVKVFYRALATDKPAIKTKAPFPTIPANLEQLNNEGYNIYVVVNGGGDKDKDVTEGKAIFYEHDKMQKEKQMVLWRLLGLPEPTLQLDTGGKSIHNYWVFDEPITIDKWEVLIADLIVFTNADKNNKNPSRVMRLAGFKHQGSGEISTIVTKSDKKYSYDELRAIIPPTEPEPATKAKSEPKAKAKSTPSSSSSKDRSIDGENPPLDYFFRDDLREILDGVDTNIESRDCRAFEIATEAIACDRWNREHGRSHMGEPLEYHNRFCDGCTPQLDQADRDRIWESAIKRNPIPSINSNGERPPGMVKKWKAWDNQHSRKVGYYSSIEEGLVLVHWVKGENGYVKETTKIGNHIEAFAFSRNPQEKGVKLHLEFQDVQGHNRKITLSRGELAGDATSLVSQLLDRGYHFIPKQKKSFLEYLVGVGVGIETFTLTDSTGWINKSFVLPHKTIGDETIRYRDIEPSHDCITETKGDLGGWKDYVAKYCDNNSRLIFGLGIALAAPLLPFAPNINVGFHLVGESSKGKTIAMLVASSVTGVKKPSSWSTTVNGLEAIAAAHNHLLLSMDEIGQANSHELGKVIYTLGNGQGKSRMTKTLENRETKKWKVAVLSSGEKGIGAYMKEGNTDQKSGQEVRLADIPAVPFGSPFGIFESIHCFDDSKEFAKHLETTTENYRGTAIESYLSQLIANLPDSDEITNRVRAIAKSLTQATTDHAVDRIADGFALVQVALELAHSYDILPFPADRIEWSVKKMFDDWLSNRGGDGSIEIKNACDRIRHLLVTNEHSDRIYDLSKKNEGGGYDKQTVRNLLAYRLKPETTKYGDACKSYTLEFAVPPIVFKNEMAKGVNEKQLVAELQSRGWMVASDAGGYAAVRRSISGNQSRYYVFTTKCLRDSEDDVTQLETQPQYEELL